ncbi:MAG: hypothetical protein JNG85_08260, partial [Spirochaetaceae bacterium]|nr:hypothetical protein [Spirochaetaceae bacterium]
MNRRLTLLVVSVLSIQAAFAQSSGEPSEQSVLDKAREKYQNSTAPAAPVVPAPPSLPAPEEPTFVEAAQENEDEARVPFHPFVIGFVPGLSFPMGEFDAGVDLGVVIASARDILGVQAAGVFSTARDIHGFQASGVFNTARDLRGVQTSGVFNTARRVQGIQTAGVFNTASGQVDGIQSSGVFNTAAGKVEGAQLAGVFNTAAGDVEGVQAAGVFNRARNVEGLQIGLVNIAEEVDGAQIGLVNISRAGVGGVGLAYDPLIEELGAYWQTGSRSLFTVFRASAPIADWGVANDRVLFSWGLGTRLGGRHDWLYLDLEAAAAQELGPLIEAFGSMDGTAACPRTVELRPYPELRLTLGVPLGGRLHLLGGMVVDVEIDGWQALPSRLKTGEVYRDRW